MFRFRVLQEDLVGRESVMINDAMGKLLCVA